MPSRRLRCEWRAGGELGEPAPARRRRWQKFVRRGRPSTFNEDVADAMYESILETGVPDSRAGLLANVSTSTVSRWKQEDPNFAEFLETARSKFEFAELKKIRHAKRRDGQPNAQNAKWLLQHTNPEVWGGRARKRPGADVPGGASPTAPGSIASRVLPGRGGRLAAVLERPGSGYRSRPFFHPPTE